MIRKKSWSGPPGDSAFDRDRVGADLDALMIVGTKREGLRAERDGQADLPTIEIGPGHGERRGVAIDANIADVDPAVAGDRRDHVADLRVHWAW